MQTVERFGNQSSASIPAAICAELEEPLSSGEKCLLLSGFGVGLSWASAIVHCGSLKACVVIEHSSESS
jgi:3-oxoacyl-[acyl-carrier-protein] synthase-3